MNLRLRKRLTLEFVMLFILLYFVGGAVAIFVFASQLDLSLSRQLRDLSNEIIPAVEVVNNQPSLKMWVSRAKARHDQVASTIQVFDNNRHLVEQVGPPGFGALLDGKARVHDAGDVVVQSYYCPIIDGGRQIGYLQIQISSGLRDDALATIVWAMLGLTPFLALAVYLCGSWFAGNAVRPVEETMALLRQFVIDAAHEINTPVSVIEASVQTCEELFEERKLDRSDHEILAIISRASNRMNALGESLIVLARMESPQYELTQDVLKLASVVEPVMAESRQLARGKKIDLECAAVPEIAIRGSGEALERMLLNVVANAIRYTDQGKVSLSFKIDEQYATIIVEDTGCGIPKDSLPHIFERFYRVDRSRSRVMGGYGLGLSIVKAIIDRHRGTITVASEINMGTRVALGLRRA